MLKSSRAYVFYKGDVLQNVAKLTEKYVYQSLFLIKLSLQLYLKKTPTQVFYCEFFKIIKGNFFIKHLRPAASERWRLEKYSWLLVKDIIFQLSEVSYFDW